MPIFSSLSNTVSDFSPLAGDAVKRFRNQPSLFAAASELAAQALGRLDPPIRLDPSSVAMGWPPAFSATGAIEYLILPELLIDLYVRDSVLTVVPGYQISLQRQGQTWVPLSMDLGRLAEELDALRPSLVEAFEEALVEFWSEADEEGKTHWQWMADYLCRAFVHALGEARTNEQIDARAYVAGLAVGARGRSMTTSELLPGRQINAYLLQLEHEGRAMPFDARLDPYLLVELPSAEEGEGFMVFSPDTGLRYFDSAQALVTTVFSNARAYQGMRLQRVRAQGDLFDAFARTLLQMQLIQVTGLSEGLIRLPDSLAGERLKLGSEALTGFFRLDAQIRARASRWLERSLPLWLRRASAADRWHYAGALAQIALTHPLERRGWFLDGVPTLEAYAMNRLREAAAQAHPQGPPLDPSNIEAYLEYVEPDLIAAAGGPSQAHLQEEPLSIIDLALDNLTAHSRGWLKLKAKPGTTLPSWLDGDALKALVRQIDVGAHYPRLLREHLLEGSEATRRRAQFCTQVVMQLPLLAWELLLRGEAGLDRRGYRLIEGGLGAAPIKDSARLMRLAITAGPGYGVDTISATYVFIHEHAAAQPCVLYRPLHAEQLRQYPSLDALWDDLSAPGDLQDEALRWMTDLGRTRYSHGGWREPRVSRFAQGDEFAPLIHPAPAKPVLVPLAAPVLQTLYHDVVSALIESAERRSVSNSEDHWRAFGRLAWTLFNGLLPLFSGPLSAAGWLVQLSEQFGEYLQATDEGSAATQDARNDLLFNIVMLLMSEAVHWPINEPARLPGDEAEPGLREPEDAKTTIAPLPEEVPLLTEPAPSDPPILAELVINERAAVPRPMDFDLRWASVSLALSAEQQRALAALRARPPLETLSPIPHGPTEGLFLHEDRLLLFMHDHFYNVSLADGTPRIIGPRGEPGPYLRRDEAGRWKLDLRLRLQGGGPKRRIEARRRQNEQDREQAEALYTQAMPAFDAVRERTSALAERIDREAPTATSQAAQREELDALLRQGYEETAQLIDRYRALHVSTPLPNFPERVCQLLSRQMHLSKVITDNLYELTSDHLRTSGYTNVDEAALREAMAADLPRWHSFLERFEALTQRALTYVQAHQRTVEHIEMFPGLGGRTLEASSISVHTLASVLELRSALVYCQLCLALEPLRDVPELANDVHRALEPVLVHSTSHAEAVNNPALTPEELTRVLDTAIDHYQRSEDALRVFAQTLAPGQRSPALGRIEQTISELRQDAEQRMGKLVRSYISEPAGPSRKPGKRPAQPRPRPSVRPSASGSRHEGEPAAQASDDRQVISTANGQSIMAHVRTDERTQAQIAEVFANGRVLASWQLDAATGLWREPASAPPAVAPQSKARLNTLIRDADQALGAAQRDLQQVNRFKQVTRVPADIEDQYHGHAARLDEYAEQIERALTQMNATDAATEEHGSAEVKARELREQATHARSVGTRARIDLSLSMMPTAGRVKFLLDAGEVSIRRIGQRAPLRKEGRRDYVQEYEVLDRAQRPLWYAHFHYDTATAAPERYTAAHLKTVTQRFDGYQRQLQQARDDQEVVSIYRSRIDPALARQLFLSLP